MAKSSKRAQRDRDLAAALRTVAIAGVIPSKDSSAAKRIIPAGSTLPFEARLLLSAMVKKGADGEAKPTASLLSKASVAWILERLGATRAGTEKVFAELATRALAAGGKVGDELVDEDHELLIAIHAIEQKLIAKLPPQPRAGRVTVVGTIEELE